MEELRAATQGMYDTREGTNTRATRHESLDPAAWDRCTLSIQTFGHVWDVFLNLTPEILRARHLLPSARWPLTNQARWASTVNLREFVSQQLQWVRSAADVEALENTTLTAAAHMFQASRPRTKADLRETLVCTACWRTLPNQSPLFISRRMQKLSLTEDTYRCPPCIAGDYGSWTVAEIARPDPLPADQLFVKFCACDELTIPEYERVRDAGLISEAEYLRATSGEPGNFSPHPSDYDSDEVPKGPYKAWTSAQLKNRLRSCPACNEPALGHHQCRVCHEHLHPACGDLCPGCQKTNEGNQSPLFDAEMDMPPKAMYGDNTRLQVKQRLFPCPGCTKDVQGHHQCIKCFKHVHTDRTCSQLLRRRSGDNTRQCVVCARSSRTERGRDRNANDLDRDRRLNERTLNGDTASVVNVVPGLPLTEADMGDLTWENHFTSEGMIPVPAPATKNAPTASFQEPLFDKVVLVGQRNQPLVNVLDPSEEPVPNEVIMYPRGAAPMGDGYEGAVFPDQVSPKGAKPVPVVGYMGPGRDMVGSIRCLDRDEVDGVTPCERLVTHCQEVMLVPTGLPGRTQHQSYHGTMWGTESHPLLRENVRRATFVVVVEEDDVTVGKVSVHMMYEGSWGPAVQGFSCDVIAEEKWSEGSSVPVHGGCPLVDQWVPDGEGTLSIRNAEGRYKVVLEGCWFAGYFNEDFCGVGMPDCRYMCFVDAALRWLTDRRRHAQYLEGYFHVQTNSNLIIATLECPEGTLAPPEEDDVAVGVDDIPKWNLPDNNGKDRSSIMSTLCRDNYLPWVLGQHLVHLEGPAGKTRLVPVNSCYPDAQVYFVELEEGGLDARRQAHPLGVAISSGSLNFGKTIPFRLWTVPSTGPRNPRENYRTQNKEHNFYDRRGKEATGWSTTLLGKTVPASYSTCPSRLTLTGRRRSRCGGLTIRVGRRRSTTTPWYSST